MLRRALAAWCVVVATIATPVAAGAADVPVHVPGLLRVTAAAGPDSVRRWSGTLRAHVSPRRNGVQVHRASSSRPDASAAAPAAAKRSKDDDGSPWWLTFVLLIGVAVIAAGGGSSLGQRWARRRWERRHGPLSDLLDDDDPVDDDG